MITAHFRGGPLGGEVRAMPERLPIIRVPALHRVNVFSQPYPQWHVEEYELTRSLYYGTEPNPGAHYEYVWVNPNRALINENQRLRSEIAGLRHAVAVRDALRVIKDAL